jgi:hypothetical protein
MLRRLPCSLIAVDEGLDRIVRLDPTRAQPSWTIPLEGKCRKIQALGDSSILAVSETGFIEIDINTGVITREKNIYSEGVVSLERLPNGHTVFCGVSLGGASGVSFTQFDSDFHLVRSVSFPGDYVRYCSLTDKDTILFSCNDRVCEANWDGLIVREFAIDGFVHAWKATRISGDRTLIAAGYGAFVVECDSAGQETRRWCCRAPTASVRPFFFSDFDLQPDGTLMVCNWLGHGPDQGRTGCSILEFDANGDFHAAWQGGEKTSSIQCFVKLPK